MQSMNSKHDYDMSHRLTLNATENADVITSSIAQSQDGLRTHLVSDSQAWCEIVPVPFDVEVRADTADACNPKVAGAQIQETAVLLAIHVLWVNNVPTQTVGDGQL